MNRDQFIAKWQERLLWLGQRGLALDTDERPRGPYGAGLHALKLPEKVQQMAAEMWADVQGEPKPAVNGVAQPTAKR